MNYELTCYWHFDIFTMAYSKPTQYSLINRKTSEKRFNIKSVLNCSWFWCLNECYHNTFLSFILLTFYSFQNSPFAVHHYLYYITITFSHLKLNLNKSLICRIAHLLRCNDNEAIANCENRIVFAYKILNFY